MSITVITPIHYKGEESYNKLIETIDSFKAHTNITDYQHILSYDKHLGDPEHFEAKLRNIESTLLFTMGDKNGIGIARGLVALKRAIKTPYIFILEGDWVFLKDIDLQNVVNIMDKYPFINYIRFNKRENIVFEPFDFVLEKEDKVNEMDLLRIFSYSGNPHIVRTAYFKDTVIPVISKSYWYNHPKRGLEAAMTDYVSSNEFQGTYLYGKLNDPPVVKHIG